MIRRAVYLLCLLLASPALGVPLEMPPTARLAASDDQAQGSLRVPVTSWHAGGPQTIWAEGAVRRAAWQFSVGQQTSMQILAPLKAQLAAAGYETIFSCDEEQCGGFDFRYALDLLPEPAMHVDLGDYHYVAAQRTEADRPDYVLLVVSRAGRRGFLHVTTIGAAAPVPEPPATQVTASSRTAPSATVPSPATPAVAPDVDVSDLATTLRTKGRAVLSGLAFSTGSARLSAGPFPSLDALAEWMKANPEAQIVLVGHTDAEGSLSNNLALSRARAQSVRQRMATAHGIASRRMRAEGVGYLSPMSTNATEAGRTRNRRVEVILTDPSAGG